MAKITYYPKVTELADEDIFLIDGEGSGTRTIQTSDLAKELQNRLDVDVYSYLDSRNIPVYLRRNVYRGANLGNFVSDELYGKIQNGDFRNIFIGDYFHINDIDWIVTDINYWIGTGDTNCVTNHVVITPSIGLLQSKMNNDNTTEGGYFNSYFYKETKPLILTKLNEAFGNSHILNHREVLSNAVSNGIVTGGVWSDSYFELLSETELYGHTMMSSMPISAVSNTQLSLFRIGRPNASRYPIWLRDVAGSDKFSAFGYDGVASASLATQVRWCIPVFGIC